MLETLLRRLERLGIYLELSTNYPWIYIDKINEQKVTETFYGEHGFTIAFYPDKITDVGEIFKLIRKYVNNLGG